MVKEPYVKRDNALRDVIYHHLLSWDSNCKLEQVCSSSNNKRPGNIYHPDFLDELPAYFDITVRNSLLPKFLTFAAILPQELQLMRARGRKISGITTTLHKPFSTLWWLNLWVYVALYPVLLRARCSHA